MAKKTESFQYGIDNLYTVPENNPLRVYDYVNGIIDKYQNLRKATINEKQDWDELQVAKERYSKKPQFTSRHAPFKDSDAMIVAVRENGYLAYIKDVPSVNPFTEIATTHIESISEYMNEYYGNRDLGFFYFRGELTCIIEKDKYLVIKFTDLVNPLSFCESYVYDDTLKTIVFSSPYYNETTVKAYTKEEFINLDGENGSHYFYVTNSKYDLIPKGKYPGYPLYKRIVLDEMDNNFDSVIINDQSVDISENVGKVVSVNLDLAQDGKCFVYIEASGTQKLLHIAFTPLYLSGIEPRYELSITFKKGSQTYSDLVSIPTGINEFNPLTDLITIKSDDIYLDVPMEYELQIPLTDYIDLDKIKNLTDVSVHFLSNTQNERMYFDSFVGNSAVKFITDPITIPNQSELPTELRFNMVIPVKDSVSINPNMYLDGYSTSAIYRVPDNFLRVEQKFLTDLKYTEFNNTKYRVTFKGNGTLTIESVTLKRVTDTLGYFSAGDFQMEKVSEEDGLFTYDIILNEKIFINPVINKNDTLRFVFQFNTKRRDDQEVIWPGEVLEAPMVITYCENRWEIRDVSFSNFLTGSGLFTYRIYDLLLKTFTDRYSEDPRLILNSGNMVFSSNVKDTNNKMDWNFRDAYWSTPANIDEYGDITLQFIDTVAKSNKVTLKHDRPVNPLTATRRDTTLYENITGRVYYDLTYNDTIRELYIDGGLITKDTIFTCEYSRNGVATMSVVYSPSSKNIIGLGIDYTPLKGVTQIPYSFKVTMVNDHDYTNWEVPLEWIIPVKPQTDTLNFTLRLIDFGYNKEVEAILSLNVPELEDAQVVCTIVNPADGRMIGSPNFDPIGNSDFRSTNFEIGNEFVNVKDFILTIEIYEYDNAAKDNLLPNRLYYYTELAFKVN